MYNTQAVQILQSCHNLTEHIYHCVLLQLTKFIQLREQISTITKFLNQQDNVPIKFKCFF
ncbi:unnamed protein product [Paramecium sonneborni]|uniref:Uncharacterized protein n=1 Tax=Paramecium sonneborni TaxID=65129 RepID=A0A8S1MUZ0_9CILI|nr:unnamed protein product [Paramecium sonneborni]